VANETQKASKNTDWGGGVPSQQTRGSDTRRLLPKQDPRGRASAEYESGAIVVTGNVTIVIKKRNRCVQ